MLCWAFLGIRLTRRHGLTNNETMTITKTKKKKKKKKTKTLVLCYLLEQLPNAPLSLFRAAHIFTVALSQVIGEWFKAKLERATTHVNNSKMQQLMWIFQWLKKKELMGKTLENWCLLTVIWITRPKQSHRRILKTISKMQMWIIIWPKKRELCQSQQKIQLLTKDIRDLMKDRVKLNQISPKIPTIMSLTLPVDNWCPKKKVSKQDVKKL